MVSAQFTPAGLSQDLVRSVEGVVTDASGSPIPDAVVQVKNLRTLQIRSFLTKKDGRYHFHELSTEIDYELKARFHQQSSSVKMLTRFDSRQKATIDLKIDLKG
jgi:hypothetical protein